VLSRSGLGDRAHSGLRTDDPGSVPAGQVIIEAGDVLDNVETCIGSGGRVGVVGAAVDSVAAIGTHHELIVAEGRAVRIGGAPLAVGRCAGVDQVGIAPLIVDGQYANIERGQGGVDGVGVGVSAGGPIRDHAVVGDVVGQASGDGGDVLHGSFLLGLLDGGDGVGDQERSQDSDDRDDDQQLDERESFLFFHLKPPFISRCCLTEI